MSTTAQISPEWEAWMSAWEAFIDAVLAMPATGAEVAPQTPDVAIPFGRVPVELHDRLRRAQAMREHAMKILREQMAATAAPRTFTAAPDAPAAGRVIDM